MDQLVRALSADMPDSLMKAGSWLATFSLPSGTTTLSALVSHTIPFSLTSPFAFVGTYSVRILVDVSSFSVFYTICKLFDGLFCVPYFTLLVSWAISHMFDDSSLWYYIFMHYVWKDQNLFSNVWNDAGEAPGALYSDPSTGSDIIPGQEILLNFTSCSILMIPHISKQ